MSRLLHFDLDALRCFVLGIELGSFALAAQRLHRSTSAASAQLKKLERQCGVSLVRKAGRRLLPTDEGELLLSYARRLLALNDEAGQAIRGLQQQGQLCFGMQEDFSEVLLPRILAQFSRAHPNVQLSTQVGRNAQLFAAVTQGDIDLALSWAGLQTPAYSELLAQLPLCWIGPQQTALCHALLEQPSLPLVMFESPCLMRQQATEALDRLGIRWRIAFVSSSLNGIWQAVEAGLGITVRTAFGMPKTLQPLNLSPLPVLPDIGIRLDRANEQNTVLQQQFCDLLQAQFAQYLGVISPVSG